MTPPSRSRLVRILVLAAVLVAAWAAWAWGPSIVERWTGRDRVAGLEEPGLSADLADETLDRLERLRAGEGPDRLALGAAELSSVVRFALPGLVPPGVERPTVRMAEGNVVLTARVAVEAFPELPSLDQVVGLLPDSVDILMEGSLSPWGRENLALRIHRLEASGIPVPGRMIPDVLEALGRRDREGLSPQSMLIPLPDGLSSAFVERDSLVLVADR